MTILSRFVKDESGATAIEYGLIASLIAVGIITPPAASAPSSANLQLHQDQAEDGCLTPPSAAQPASCFQGPGIVRGLLRCRQQRGVHRLA